MNRNETLGVIVVGHGSPRAEANAAFVELVDRVAARLDGVPVRAAFFSLATPTVTEQAGALVERGVRRIAVLPYFLHMGQHVRSDLPAQLRECEKRYPGIHMELLATLHNEPAIEDVLVERLSALEHDESEVLMDGGAIARRSAQLIERRLRSAALGDAERAIVRRMVHATADFSFAHSVRIHSEAAVRGVAAIRSGAPVVCDVQMLKAVLTHLKSDILCAIGEPEVRVRAAAASITRAAAAMEVLAPRFGGAIVAIGNAPTALWKVMQLVQAGAPRPALVVGLPVGLVGAREAKQALIESGLCYITNIGPRGGSPVAAAAVNALATLAFEKGQVDG